MRTTIRINDTLLKEARKLSRERNCTLGEIVDEALRLTLVTRKKAAKHKRERPLVTFKGSGAQPGVELNDSAALLGMMDR